MPFLTLTLAMKKGFLSGTTLSKKSDEPPSLPPMPTVFTDAE